MTVFDYIVIAVVLASLLFGLWRGVIGEVIALVAWGLGIFAAVHYGDWVGQRLLSGLEDPLLRLAGGCVLVFIAVLFIMALLRMATQKLVQVLGLTVSDRLLGMCFGLVRGLLIIFVMVAIGGMTSAPSQVWWRQATLSPPLETAVLALKPMLPQDLAKRIRFS